MNDLLQNIIKQFIPFAQKQIGFKNPPRLFLRNDQENADNPLGKTAFYDPAAKSVTLYITGRHPKDILRSLGHELVHHKQNCDGHFDDSGDMGQGYAQRDPHLRQMEIDANRDGSMCLRDFEDMLKKENTIYYEHLQRGENKMSTKDWKNKEIGTLISEAWGFKFNSLQEFDEFSGNGEVQTEGEEEEEIEELAQAKGAGDRRKPHKRETVPEDDEEIEEGLMDMVGLGDDEEDMGDLEEAEDAGDEEEIEEGFTTNMPKDIPTTGQVMQKMRDDGTAPDDSGAKKAKRDKKGDKKNESVNSIQEAIAKVLRKHLKG